jgi:hypothetical protein
MNETSNLANLIRAYHGKMSRNELKVARAKLRRAGVTCHHKSVKGPYTLNPATDKRTDTRADEGTVVAQIAAFAR